MCAILLVGDTSAEMASLAEVLKRYQHRIIRSRDGQTALDVVRTGGAPDIIVADMAAAGPKGMDLLTGMRQESPRIPVILLAGRASREEQFLARNLGDNAYVLRSAKVKNMERMITAIVTEGQRSRAREHARRKGTQEGRNGGLGTGSEEKQGA